MKLIYVIISNDDSDRVVYELNKENYSATKLSTTGGFLKKGNTTLMICTEDENVEKVAKLVENVCGKRETVEISVPIPSFSATYSMPMYYNTAKQKVEVGGAVIFAVDVAYYNRL